jgi:hypothetical protein
VAGPGGMGPSPKPDGQRRRRNTPLANTIRLPAEGRKGPPPKWPYPRPSPREKQLWRKLWATPMAVAWERLGWEEQVARYVRVLLVAEQPNLSMPALAEARQMEDRLGLNPLALVRLRWEVVPDELAVAREERQPVVRRLKAVDPGAKVARPKRTG